MACRKEIAQYFEQNIKNDSIIIPKALNRDNVYHIFPILCVERNRLQEFLKGKWCANYDTLSYPPP